MCNVDAEKPCSCVSVLVWQYKTKTWYCYKCKISVKDN